MRRKRAEKRAVKEHEESTRQVKRTTRVKRKPDSRTISVSIIGAGRLGTALALALDALDGYIIEAVAARRLSQARRAAGLLRVRPKALAAAELNLLPPTDLLFITTRDDAIAATAAQLARVFSPQLQQRHIAFHMSGALSSEILRPLGRVGFHTGSMHPLISISNARHGAESLREAFYCIEGDAQTVRAARRIVRALGAQSFKINARDKALYHAAAVMSAGHIVALFDMAAETLAHCKLSAAQARKVLLPLARSTIENLSVISPARALTGSFARADIVTVRNHLAAMRSKKALRAALEVYLLLGAHSLELARENGVNPAALEEIRRLLKRTKLR
jgi:predicted short-subunit dehydrogenase-like oxidoreductase (DUF2520 family)